MILSQLIFGIHDILNTIMDAKKEGAILLVCSFTESLCFLFWYMNENDILHMYPILSHCHFVVLMLLYRIVIVLLHYFNCCGI